MAMRSTQQDLESLSPEEALCALACHSLYADDSVTRDENDTLYNYLGTLGAFRRGRRQVRQAISKVNRLAREEGEEEFLSRAASALPATLRPVAYFAVADLVLGDRDLSPEEEEYLEHIRGLLGLSNAQAENLLQVARIKNAV